MANTRNIRRNSSRLERPIQDVRVVRLDARAGHGAAVLRAAGDLQREVTPGDVDVRGLVRVRVRVAAGVDVIGVDHEPLGSEELRNGRVGRVVRREVDRNRFRSDERDESGD